MRAHEVIDDYINPTRIDTELEQELRSVLARMPRLTPYEMYMMYGADHDLDRERTRTQNAKTRAEIEKIRAETAALKRA